MNKLEEQAKAKGELSYSAWVNTHAPANSAVPRKLSEADLQAQQQQQDADRAGAGATASAWNSAGTFEERCVTPWAKERLTALLPGTTNGRAVVVEVTAVTGEAHVWFVRGKKRHGFELSVTCRWRSGGSVECAAEPGGTLTLPSASPDELDDADDLRVEAALDGGGGEGGGEGALAAARALKPELLRKLNEFYAQLKAEL